MKAGSIDSWTKNLTLLAVTTLPFRYGPIYLWPSILLTLIAALLGLISFFKNKPPQELKKQLYFWIKIFSFFFFFVLIGSILKWVGYGVNYTDIKWTTIQFMLMGIYVLGFLLILYYAKNKIFRRRILIAFLSPLAFTPFIFMPEYAEKLGLVVGSMFHGLDQGPMEFARSIIIPITILLILFVRTPKWIHKFIYLFGITLASSLLLWSGIRASWIGATLIILIILSIETIRKSRHKLRFVVPALLLLSLAGSTSYLILPHRAQISVLNRVFPQVIDNARPTKQIFQETTIKKALLEIRENPRPSLPYQSRGEIWPQAAKALIRNPFGLGINYHVGTNIIIQKDAPTRAHNSILDVGLQGGIGALVIYLFLIWKQTQSLIFSKKKEVEWLILGGAFGGLFIISLVNGGLFGGNDLLLTALIISLEQDTQGLNKAKEFCKEFKFWKRLRDN